MWVFESSTGRMFKDDSNMVRGIGWSGQGLGKNNPDMQNVPDVGPIPVGRYTIGAPYHHPKLGPITMDLEPDTNNEMYGRSLFRIHGFGEDKEHASEGCIIQVPSVRQAIADSGDNQLEVVSVRQPAA